MINQEAQRVAIFIDTQNLYHSAKSVFGRKVNFANILKDVTGKRQLVRAFAYVIETERGDEKQFFQALEAQGIELKVKDLMIFSDGSKKADWDIGLAIDTIKMAPKLDTVVILSGDTDFVPLVEYLQQQMMVRVEVGAFGKSAGLKIREVADEFIDLALAPQKYLIGYRTQSRRQGGGQMQRRVKRAVTK